jgi:hypothetical protein
MLVGNSVVEGRLKIPNQHKLQDCSSNKGMVMLFMVIERFRDNDMIPIYQRLRDSGRSLPDGLEYVDSWVEPNFGRCFQLMRCNDMRILQKWVLQWRGSGATFEIIPVVPSKETREVVAPYLEPPSENSS